MVVLTSRFSPVWKRLTTEFLRLFDGHTKRNKEFKHYIIRDMYDEVITREDNWCIYNSTSLHHRLAPRRYFHLPQISLSMLPDNPVIFFFWVDNFGLGVKHRTRCILVKFDIEPEFQSGLSLLVITKLRNLSSWNWIVYRPSHPTLGPWQVGIELFESQYSLELQVRLVTQAIFMFFNSRLM